MHISPQQIEIPRFETVLRSREASALSYGIMCSLAVLVLAGVAVSGLVPALPADLMFVCG